MHLEYLQNLQGKKSGTGQTWNMRSIGSPYMDKGRLAFLMASHVLCDCGFGHIKIPAPEMIFYETRWLKTHFYQQDTALCSRCGAARCMNIRAAQRIQYGWSAWVTTVPALLVFYSIPFYSILLQSIYIYLSNYYF